MQPDIQSYIENQSSEDKRICTTLAKEIDLHLNEAESKIWHAHPVWFLEGNPVVGFSKQKGCIRLMFWSGDSFDEAGLEGPGGKFKDASKRYTHVDQIDREDLKRWLEKSRDIQWDYKNIVKRKGRLERLK